MSHHWAQSVNVNIFESRVQGFVIHEFNEIRKQPTFTKGTSTKEFPLFKKINMSARLLQFLSWRYMINIHIVT